jgi:predicted NBD/HSP70 family sugar kinase
MPAPSRNPISDSAGHPGSNRGAVIEELRRHNLSAVLERVHLAGPVSRSELATQTGLNRSTIRDLLGELIELGLVVESTGTTSRSRGRPSAVARARPEGAVVLAVELEVDFTAAATIGLGGHIFDRVRVQNPEGATAPEQIVDQLERLTEPLLSSLPGGHRLIGIGAAAAGVVRREDGFVAVSPNRGWIDIPLAEMISRSLGVDRVRVANEADAGALGELRRGAAREARHVIYVAGEIGVGLGIINDGQPMLGTAGYAGEAGHNVINPSGRECRCGSIGGWETEVGEEALARHAGIRWGEFRQGLTDEVLRRAHAGDPQVFAAFREIGRWLGLGVANLVNTFNPDLVVFGGFYHPIYPFLEGLIEEQAARTALSAPWSSCTICRSELGPDARLIGASELVLAEVIGDPSSLT